MESPKSARKRVSFQSRNLSQSLLNNSSGVFVELTVAVATKVGDCVYVCGGVPEFGNWNPKSAVPLKTSSDQYPYWNQTVQLPQNQKVSYKYFIKNSQNDIEWEDLPEDRVFQVIGPHVVVNDGVFGDNNSAQRVHGRVQVRWEKQQQSVPMNSLLELRNLSDAGQTFTLFNCSLRLPLKVQEIEGKKTFEFDHDNLYGIARGFYSLPDNFVVIWLGMLDFPVPENEQKAVKEEIFKKFKMIPIFCESETVEKHYSYCKKVLWPQFHSISYSTSEIWNENVSSSEYWEAYQSINTAFSKCLIEAYEEEGLIWVHDYHLLTLPTNIRKHISDAKIGLFLHTPFPPYEIFRTLPHGSKILNGMLGSSLIGFHLFDYARHFLSSCVRMLSIEYHSKPGGLIFLEHNSRVVNVRVSHVGVDAERLKEVGGSPETRALVNELKSKYDCSKNILLGICPLDYIKGVTLKLKAFETFLETFPDQRGKVILIQANTPRPHIDPSIPEKLKSEIEAIGDRINKKYGTNDWTPIHLLWCPFPLNLRVAYYKISRTFISTSMREGLDLTAYEYLFTDSFTQKGVVLSDFSGCTKAISAVRANPYDANDVANAIHKTLNTPKSVSMELRKKDLRIIEMHAIQKWAISFVSDLVCVTEKRKHLTTMGLSLGLTFDLSDLSGSGFKELNSRKVLRKYRKTDHRLLLFDFEGTMVEQDPNQTTQPSQEVLSILENLSANPKNVVVILSGKRKEVMEKWFGRCVNLNLGAEHGYYFRFGANSKFLRNSLLNDSTISGLVPSSPSPSSSSSFSFSSWEKLYPTIDLSWVSTVQAIVEMYCDKIDGSYADIKQTSVVWYFGTADREFVAQQANELRNHITTFMSAFPIQVILASNLIEIRCTGINKGTTAELLTTKSSISFDFALCIGDDRSDEDMFSVLNSWIPNQNNDTAIDSDSQDESQVVDVKDNNFISSVIRTVKAPQVFCVTVGKKPSHARYFLPSATQVNELLREMSLTNRSAHRTGSLADISKFGQNKAALPSSLSSTSLSPTPPLSPSSVSKQRLDFNQFRKQVEERSIRIGALLTQPK